jgi:DNA-binding transcriptional LysR family regulator
VDRLDAMSVFLAVVDAGSLSAAGRRLRIPLPTVSRRIAELEARLNAKLLVRTTRTLVLTDAGTAYAAACRDILESVAEAERAVTGEYEAPQGELVLTAPIVMGRLHMLPVLTAFLSLHPRIDARLVLSDRLVPLADDHVDAALRVGELTSGSAVITRIGQVRRVTCASPAFLDRHGMPQAPDSLSDLTAIAFDALTAAAEWEFSHPGRGNFRVSLQARLKVNTAEAAVDAAISGAGVTRVLSYQIADAVRRGALQIVLAEFEPAPFPVHLVHLPGARLPRKTRAFLDFAAPRLRERLAASLEAVRSGQ